MNYTKLGQDIVDWIRNYATDANMKSLVVGVSGGVDSALVSTLCAMTGLRTHCVIMPCQSKLDQTDRSITHIEWLRKKFNNISSYKIDLTTTYESFQNEIPGLPHSPLGDANTKSRLRMVALYRVAASVEGLVVGTGNKVEDFGVGFYTKYGDGGVDISPIADLYKSEVRQLCRELGVLPELSEAVPTDGLWTDNRTDEEQIGATYDELEWAMQYEGSIMSLTDRQLKVLDIYNDFHEKNSHKMIPIPTYQKKNEY